MENDSFTEISSENWFSRLGSSIKGILFGLFLFIAAFPLLWWNEGRSVERYNSLKEGQGMVISVSSDNVDPANNGKLIHTQGYATTEEILRDDIFGVTTSAIKLIRNVSMYQWKENINTETNEKIGGSKETIKTYSYVKDWNSQELNSSHFKKPAGHSNPGMAFKNKRQQAQLVTLGLFRLNPSQVNRIAGETDLTVYDAQPPTTLVGKAVSITENGFYLGDSPNNPQIGDLKIHFQVVKPKDISLIAQQQENSFSAYQTKAGSPIDLLETGLVDAHAMFVQAQKENTLMTWLIRIGGSVMMWIGLGLILKPLVVFASVLPFLGNLISIGTGILAFLVALPCSMLTIAFAWIAYRPLLATGLIAVAVLSLVAIKFLPRKNAIQQQAS